jgi:hypothetical protein
LEIAEAVRVTRFTIYIRLTKLEDSGLIERTNPPTKIGLVGSVPERPKFRAIAVAMEKYDQSLKKYIELQGLTRWLIEHCGPPDVPAHTSGLTGTQLELLFDIGASLARRKEEQMKAESKAAIDREAPVLKNWVITGEGEKSQG